MISIAEAISDLLFVRDTVVVPGLGAFVKKPLSAEVNPVANYFTMPSCQVEFDAHLREDNDLVVSYMSEKNDIPADEARRLLNMFVSDCFNSLKTGKKVPLNGVGSLSYDWTGDLVFHSDETQNYNADAFGLCDFSPVPVVSVKTKDDIKAEIEQQQRERNTPMTVDEKAVHEGESHHERHRGWLWALLALLVLLAGIGFALHHTKSFDFKEWRWLERPEKPSEIEPWTITHPDAKVWKTEVVAPVVEDSVVAPPVKVVIEPETVRPESNIRIIGGCFSQEENAERLANSLKEKGYKQAFVEKRGNKWFVAYGRYATDEEATTALREIRAKGDGKAWILKEKK